MSKTALITGVAGQDGAYLTELLLEKGYRVFGMDRQAGNLMDQMSLIDLIEEAQPDEIYNFAAQSFIPLSWKEPVITGDVNALGVTRILEAIRRVKPDVKFYQASSSELFGKPETKPQNENTPFNPGTPYGTAKLYAHNITANYRDKLGLFSCSGILYNHESPRRGKEFVTRKITLSAAKIKLGLQKELHLGNLDAHRDWGFAKDYVHAMWLMLQQDEPDDYVIATGEEHSVRELVETAFSHLGLEWEKYVVQDPKFFRPVDLNMLVGDSSKARKRLNWKPSVSFDQLVKLMVDSDVKELEKSL